MSANGGRKKSEPRERRMIVDYVRTRYPDSVALFNMRLGGIPQKLNGVPIENYSPNIAQPWARYADAIIILPDRLIIVEAKIPAKLEAVAQLPFYRTLVEKTPELAAYRGRPVELELVTAVPDPELVEYATSQGIRVVEFAPAYVMEYLGERLGGRFRQ